MFVEAIEEVDNFTRPIYSISRTFGGSVTGGTGTFFFVNENGVAVTCKHVAQLIIQAEEINQRYRYFRAERQQISTNSATFLEDTKTLEQKYGYEPSTVIQMKHNFFKAFDSIEGMEIHLHGTLDLAIIEFKGFKEKRYSSFARFIADPQQVKQGRTLCRLGYPFPEFTNFRYNSVNDDIEWTTEGNPNTPRFPMDGIITRFVGDGQQVVSIEMSTPGLRGQSGGPLFDTQGRVYGMQFLTSHYHLGFDIQQKEVMIDGQTIPISNHPFLHVGWCVHVDRMKDFLREKNISFYEA
jgi:Trypsin-like peptidase domain